ncbi:MAG: Maf family protein [Bacteroidales bacterium]
MIADLFKSKRLILASASPRRSELLAHLGIPFEVWKRDYSEVTAITDDPVKAAIALASNKADQVEHLLTPGDIVITADTVVWCSKRLLNKPSDRDDAVSMLSMLSGQRHSVITGVCLFSDISRVTFFSETFVKFKTLSTEEIAHYVDNYKPYDKAGAYGIQEWIGFIGGGRNKRLIF